MDRVVALTEEFAQLPRSGDTVDGFAAGLYPTDHPTLPEGGPRFHRSMKGQD